MLFFFAFLVDFESNQINIHILTDVLGVAALEANVSSPKKDTY